MADKSGQYDIQKAVVSSLLVDGIKRNEIRLEIPLDTASYMGRGDVVIIKERLLCIELKSGKDKFCPVDLKRQCEQYNRSFDAVGVVIDVAHRREREESNNGRTYKTHNWGNVDIQYRHDKKALEDAWNKPVSGILNNYENRFKSYHTAACDMARILWASEIKELTGLKTKNAYVERTREEGCLRDVRKLVLSALKTRPLNLWEMNFWERYDGDIKP